MTIEEMKKELARFAGQEDEAAVLPQALLSIIELAESGNVDTSQQLSDIKELLRKLATKAESDSVEQNAANAKIAEEIKGLLVSLAADAEKSRNVQKAENAKTDKKMKIIIVLLGVNALGVLAILIFG